MFRQSSVGRSDADELFMPVDPFELSSPVEHDHNDIEHGAPGGTCTPTSSAKFSFRNVYIYMSDTLPRQVYVSLLIRFPMTYFFEVAAIFWNAGVTRQDVQKIIDASRGNSAFTTVPTSESHESSTLDPNDTNVYPPGTLSPGTTGIDSTGHVSAAVPVGRISRPFTDEWTPLLVSPTITRFKHSWESYIDSLIENWEIVILASTVMILNTSLALRNPRVQKDLFSLIVVLFSLVCAILGFIYGCIYTVRFRSMRGMYWASKLAEEARKTDTKIWWNMWVLLAMPSVWEFWMYTFYFFSVASFIFRMRADFNYRPPLSAGAARGAWIPAMVVFSVGMVYLIMVVKTLRAWEPTRRRGQNP